MASHPAPPAFNRDTAADPVATQPEPDHHTAQSSIVEAANTVVSSFAICCKPIELMDVARTDSELITHDIPEKYDKYKELLATGADCDVTIVCGDKTMAAHKALLAGRIPYFSMMFDHGYAEDKSGVVNLSIQNFKFGATRVCDLIGFAYHGTIMLTERNVDDMIWAADYLGMADAIQACVQFKAERITCDSALSQLSQISYLQSIGYKDADGLVWRFIDANFVGISRTDCFKQLSLPDIITILKRDTLRVDSEQQIFDAMCMWIGADRGEQGARLLECLRMRYMPKSCINNSIRAANWVKDNPDSVALLDQHEGSGRVENIERQCPTTPRLLLFFDCNEYGVLQWEIRFYDAMRAKWQRVLTSRAPREDATAVAIGFKAFFVRVGSPDSTLVLDLPTNTWSELPGVPSPRDKASVEAINGAIVVAGGLDYGNGVTTLYMDTTKEAPVWEERAARTHRLWKSASAVLGGLLFVLGGTDSHLDEWEAGWELGWKSHFEVYDGRKDEWTVLAPLLHPYIELSATAAADGCIYVHGVARGRTHRSLDRYDPKTNTWRTLAENPRLPDITMCYAMCGRILVVFKFLCRIEQFDLETSTWLEPIIGDRWYDYTILLSVPYPASATLPIPAIEDPWQYHEKVPHAEEDNSSADDDD